MLSERESRSLDDGEDEGSGVHDGDCVGSRSPCDRSLPEGDEGALPVGSLDDGVCVGSGVHDGDCDGTRSEDGEDDGALSARESPARSLDDGDCDGTRSEDGEDEGTLSEREPGSLEEGETGVLFARESRPIDDDESHGSLPGRGGAVGVAGVRWGWVYSLCPVGIGVLRAGGGAGSGSGERGVSPGRTGGDVSTGT